MNRIALLFALTTTTVSAGVLAQSPTDWLTARQTEFSQWRAAHPDVEARLPNLKAKTAALIAAHVPVKAGAKYADLTAQSAKMTATQRATAQKYFASAYAFYDLEDNASAREFFDLGLALDPANVRAIYHRGEIYWSEAGKTNDQFLRAGYRALAALYMDRVLTLGPRTPEAQKATAAMRYLAKVEEDPRVNTPTVLWPVPNAPNELWDAAYAPQMVIIPAGEYTMGSMFTENKTESNRSDFESPRHRVRIAYPLAVSKYLVTRGEFAYFVADSKYDFRGNPCAAGARTWDNPGYPQTDTHPAVCAGHVVAQAYADWLSQKTGHTYRMLSESEWEYAARGGTTTAFYWGNELEKGNANCPNCGSEWDRKGSSPVGSFPPNPFGLYDIVGNVWHVLADCWNYAYVGAPTDGSAWMTGNCNSGVERGGNFNQASWSVRSAGHRGGRADQRVNGAVIHGFRVARVL